MRSINGGTSRVLTVDQRARFVCHTVCNQHTNSTVHTGRCVFVFLCGAVGAGFICNIAWASHDPQHRPMMSTTSRWEIITFTVAGEL
jgi:hypothetical protein